MSRWQARLAAAMALALVAGAIGAAFPPAVARAASVFPTIPDWTLVGAWKDNSLTPNGSLTCLGALDPRPDSLQQQPRTISLRFLRDRRAEARPDFGGYRIYRMINTPDTSLAVLLRRYSVNAGSELTWSFSKLNPATMEYMCGGAVVHDSVLTFVDPDSSGNWIKICSKRDPLGKCTDSLLVLSAPPGPHDGFRTYYSITYEALNGRDAAYEDLFVPDSSNAFAFCDTTGWGLIHAGADTDGSLYAHMANSCPNKNGKLNNLVGPVEPTAGPLQDLEQVAVVPNPYNAREVWETNGTGELHFINLPKLATIRIYTVSGDLVRELHHNDTVRDFERWDLKSGAGSAVASGIYVYRVTAASFHFQNRFVVIR